jgi:hypothetical protein
VKRLTASKEANLSELVKKNGQLRADCKGSHLDFFKKSDNHKKLPFANAKGNFF